jgi:hypothetical protein
MTCEKDPGIYPVRLDGADVEIVGCPEHAGAAVRAFLLGRRMAAELDSVRARLALWATTDRIATAGQLAAILGAGDSFTEHLLGALGRADPGHFIRLRQAFPDVAIAWIAWRSCDPAPTPAELWHAIQRYAEREITESAHQHSPAAAGE